MRRVSEFESEHSHIGFRFILHSLDEESACVKFIDFKKYLERFEALWSTRRTKDELYWSSEEWQPSSNQIQVLDLLFVPFLGFYHFIAISTQRAWSFWSASHSFNVAQ